MSQLNRSDQHVDRLSFRKALLYIFLSVVVVFGSAVGVITYIKMFTKAHRHDPAYQIVAIVQTSPEPEGLSTGYLAELLNLSVDRPVNLYGFNSKEAVQKLLESPLIKEATVRKIRPGTIHVDYTLCTPIAYLGDCSNTALDERGVVFPFKPFFTPKKLPEIYLGIDGDEGDKDNSSLSMLWGKALKGSRIDLAFSLLELLKEHCCDPISSLIRIDVSNAFAYSYGRRQIVLEFSDKMQKVVEGNPTIETRKEILRLSPENYEQQLANYLLLRSHLREKNETAKIANTIVIDLRLSELAFISTEE